MVFDNTFYATVALVIFVAITLYFGIPKIIGKMLDGQIKKIADDLAEAKKLREEAAALLVEYERKRVAAEARISATKTEALTHVDEIATETAQTVVTQLVGDVSADSVRAAVAKAKE